MILEGGQMGEVMGGYFIRRVVTPQLKLGLLTSTAFKRNTLAGPTPPAGNNRENLISPIGSRVAGRGMAAQSKNRKSPLPDWYPRTPLRDITLICKVSGLFSLLFLFFNSFIVLFFIFVCQIISSCPVRCLKLFCLCGHII